MRVIFQTLSSELERSPAAHAYVRSLFGTIERAAPEAHFVTICDTITSHEIPYVPGEPVAVSRAHLIQTLGRGYTDWLRARVRASQPDVVHHPFGTLVPSRTQSSSIVTVHDTLHLDLPGALPPAELTRRAESLERVMTHATRVIAPTEFVAERLHAHFGGAPSRVSIVRSGVERRPQRRERKGKHVLLVPASAWPHENHARLFSAIAILAARGRAPFVALTGPSRPDRSTLMDQARRAGVAAQVRDYGAATWLDGDALLAAATAVVVPTHYESSGLHVLDAISAGAPVACSRVGALPEIARGAAVYFDPFDIVEMADAIEAVLYDAETRARCARHAAQVLDSRHAAATARTTATAYRALERTIVVQPAAAQEAAA